MQQKNNELLYLLQVLKRRVWFFFLPTIIIFSIAMTVIAFLPAVYKSSATILIENQEVPQELVQTTVTGFIEQRLQSITQVVFNRANLLSIIEDFKLYADLKDTQTTEDILDQMREDIVMEPIQADVVNNASGRTSTATIAFNLSFEGENPKKVLQTTNRLVSLFLEENLREREQKTQTTYEFLERQLGMLRSDVSIVEQKIADFKQNNLRSLPELMELNLNTLERLQKDIDIRQEMLKSLMDRKVYLEGQLATVDPTGALVSSDGKYVMSPEDELKSLYNRYIELTASRSERHPDVKLLKAQIAALEKELRTKNQLKGLSTELTILRQRLSDLQRKYSEKHPDVISTKERIRILKVEIASLAKLQKVLKHDVELKPDNPAYINLQTQIHATELEMRNEKNLLAELRNKYAQYVEHVEKTPQVEQEYRKLQRDYENSSVKYRETMLKLLAARQAKQLEDERVGERLTLVEPPMLPETPFKPKRLLLAFVAFILSCGIGLAAVAIAEFYDSAIYGRHALMTLSSIPVLGTIPYMVTAHELRLKQKRKIAIVTCGVGCLFSGLLAIHYLVTPLDIVVLNFF